MYKLANWVPRNEVNQPLFTVGLEYEFCVEEVKDGFFNTGSPKWDLILGIWKANGSSVPFKTSLYAGAAWKLLEFLESIGADYLWEKLGTDGIDFMELKHKSGKLIFEMEKFTGKDGQEKETLKVKKFIKKGEAIKSSVEPTPLVDDEIPW